MSFTNIINKFLNTRSHTKGADGKWKPERKYGETMKLETGVRVDFTAGDVVVYEELNKDIALDFFEYSTNSANVYPILHPAGYSTTNSFNSIFHTVNPNGSRWHPIRLRLANDGHPNFEVVAYDTEENHFKFNLKTPIIIPAGSRLAFRYHGDTPTAEETVTFKCIYREL